MLSVIVGGDIMPSFKNLEPFSTGDAQGIADKAVRDLLASVDYRVFNLETPITDSKQPIQKDGACFAIPQLAVNGLKSIGADAISLANNHIKDQGEAGLYETIKVLNDNGIRTFGYGKNFNDCSGIITLKKDGMSVSFIACAETEFTVLDGKQAGAMPYHDYWINKMISEAKKVSDYVVVLYHGGKEYFRYAAEYQVQRCQLMAENGADAVLCQHSHCISCFEEYNNCTILYGQGNFIFHQRNNKDITKEGFLVKIVFDSQTKELEFIPVVLNAEDKVCLAENKVKDDILNSFYRRSDEIKDSQVLENLYADYAQKNLDGYMGKLQGSNQFIKLILRVLKKLGVKQYSKKDMLSIQNVLQNESHRELLIKALQEEIKKEKGD